MSDFCFIDKLVDPYECVGNSLSTINFNMSALDVNLCELSSKFVETPVIEIIRNANNICFSKTRIIGDETAHLFGGIVGDGAPSTWTSCYRKLTAIQTCLSGTTLRFPSITYPTNYNTGYLATLDSSMCLKQGNPLSAVQQTILIKDNLSTVVRNPSAIKFTGTVSTNNSDGGEALVNTSPLTLMDSLSTFYLNTSVPNMGSVTPVGQRTTYINVSSLSGYSENYSKIYVFYKTQMISGDAQGWIDSYAFKVNDFPMGETQIQGGDRNSDSGYVFIKIPDSKILTVYRYVAPYAANGYSVYKPQVRSELKLYGWST